MNPAGSNLPGTLLVADAAGHILERMALTWSNRAQGVAMEVVRSEQVSLAGCCSRGLELGAVHWLDMRRGVRAASLTAAPQVVTVHHHLSGEEELVRKLGAEADVLTAVSKSWQERLQKLTNQPVWLTSQSVDTDWFRPEPDRVVKQRQAGIREGTFAVGFVGKAGANVADRKGTDIFLQTVTELAGKRALAVVLVGTGWDKFAEELRGRGLIVIRRSYPDCKATREAYGLMDALLVTAREEGGPATVLEAMAAGVPVMATPVGHVPELVQDGETGLICPVGDVGYAVSTLGRLSADAAWGSKLAAHARQLVVREWDDRKVIPRIDFAGIRRAAQERYGARPERELKARQQRLRWVIWRQRLADLLRKGTA